MKKFYKMLLDYFEKDDLKKIIKTKVLIIGCGGLGSNLADLLVRCGFKNIILADYDRITLKNLNRQNFFFNSCGKKKVKELKNYLLRINPDINIKAVYKKIKNKNLEDLVNKEKIDIVVEAVDNEATKKMIFEKVLSLNKKVICASGIAGYGDCENIKIKRGRNFSVVGDIKKSIKNFKPLAPKVSTVASIQADEVLRMVLKNE